MEKNNSKKNSRYIRQELLEQIGKKGQQKISSASIVIIGVGALGTMTSELLVRAGIKKILLIDKDKVSLENLHRQTLFEEKDVGKYKVDIAKKKLSNINSEVEIQTKKDFFTEKNFAWLKNYDLILDCTDNMKSRHEINKSCKKLNKPWIYAAVSGVRGNVLFVKDQDVFTNHFKSGETFNECQELGVINTITTIISSVQVNEAIKFLVNKKPCEDLIRINIWNNEYEKIKIKKIKSN